MYRKTTVSTLLAALCAVPWVASGAGISWNYVDGGLTYFDPDRDGADSEIGLALRGSYAIDSHWYIAGGYSTIEFDAPGPDVDVSAFTIGGGYVFPVRPDIDVFAQGSLVLADFSGPVDDDELGIEAKGGIRVAVAPRVEVLGFAALLDIDSPFDDGIEIGGGGLYHVNSQFSVGGELTLDNNVVDGTELLFLARFNF